MAMYLGGQAVKILAPSINLFDKSLIQAHAADFDQCSEYEISADKNTIIARGNTSATSQDFTWSSGWVGCGARSARNDGKGIKLSKGDVVTVSADFTLIEQGHKRAAVCCYLQSEHPSISITPANAKDISETPQRLTWEFTVTGDAVDFYPLFPINSNKVKIQNISVNKVKDYWRIRSGVYMGRNPKNLISLPYEDVLVQNGSTHNGVTYTISDDGIVTLNGTSTEAYWFRLNLNIPMTEGKIYTVSGSYNSPIWYAWRVAIQCHKTDGTEIAIFNNMDKAVTFTAPAGTVVGRVYLYTGAGQTFNNQVFKPMLNEGTKALPYFYYD